MLRKLEKSEMAWKVTEITLEARYAGNHPADTLIVSCQSFTKVPGASKRSHF